MRACVHASQTRCLVKMIVRCVALEIGCQGSLDQFQTLNLVKSIVNYVIKIDPIIMPLIVMAMF